MTRREMALQELEKVELEIKNSIKNGELQKKFIFEDGSIGYAVFEAVHREAFKLEHWTLGR